MYIYIYICVYTLVVLYAQHYVILLVTQFLLALDRLIPSESLKRLRAPVPAPPLARQAFLC